MLAVAGALPRKLHGVPGGRGTREDHGEARHVVANSGEAVALAGEAQTIGAGRLLSLRAPAGEDAHGEAALRRL